MPCRHERTARTDNRKFACGQADIEPVCKVLYDARTMQGLVLVADIEEKCILQGLFLGCKEFLPSEYPLMCFAPQSVLDQVWPLFVCFLILTDAIRFLH